MIPILDWIFEGIVGWIASIISQLFDAVSGLFLEALGTDMTAMEEYFPFVTKAYDVMQITAWAILILITVWQLFRAFGGPITEAENPWHLVVRGAIFAFLIGYAKPIFSACLSIARAPYTSLMELSMTGEDFTFAGVEQALTNGLTTLVSVASVVGLILILILEIALGWNYFKLLLETVERYIVVGVLCYTSPLAFSMGGSKTTNTVFRSWCRMVGSQLLLLVMNVWFLRGFASSMGQFIANGGALSTGKGSIFLWMFCALAYLKCAQRFDSYLASMGLNVAQTGSSMGMELMMAARVITGMGSGARSAGNVFSRGGAVATGTGAAANGFAAGFASRFSPNSYVRDAVVEGGSRMGFSGGAGFVGRAFGGIAARNGATLNGNSISSVATRPPNASGTIAGDIADRSLSNYMPHMQGFQLQGTQITGGHISTTAVSADGKKSSVDMFNAAQYEKPDVPHSVVTASDGSQWYQMASGEGRGAFYDAPVFNGAGADMPQNPGSGNADAGVNTEAGQPTGESLATDGVEGHPGMSPFPGVSEDGGVAGFSAPEGTVLTGDAADDHPNLVPFPGSTEEGAVVGGSQDGTVLTGDGTEVPQGMVTLPNSMEEGTAFGGSIQEGTVLSGDGADAPAGMVAFPASGEDQQPGGFVPGEAGTVGTTLDIKITGGLTIQKATNTGNNLDGWVFGVYTDSACTKPISGSPFTTPASGKITITGLEPGTYYVKETSNSIDYWITDNGVKSVKVTDGSNETVYVTNTNYGYGKIIKKTNTGDNLEGWKFNVYTDSALTKTVSGSPFTTDEDGLIVMDLLPGTYYVQEVDESDKYPDWSFDTTVRKLTVVENTTKSVTFTNSQAGYAEIIKKTNTGGSLSGWKFNIYSDVDCTKLVDGSPFTTDASGVITVKIAPGTYYVKEVDESDSNPLWDYDTTTRKVVVKAGETGSVTFSNTHYGYGQIIKKTNTGGTLDGWKFNVYTDEACTKLVSGSPFTTNAQGLITTRLLPGTYYVKEVDESSKRPDWDFDTTTRKLTVTAGNTSSVTFNNIHYGYAQIVKETSTGENLGGWKFNIYADETCTTLIDGSPFTSADDGTIKVRLKPGTYWVQEIDESDVNPHWTYDTTVRKVTVTAGDVAEVTFTNTHYGYAQIVKVTNTGKDLAGWKFNIYADADCTQLITGSPFTSDEEGKIVARLLPGTYFVQEIDESDIHPDWCYDESIHVVNVKAGETASVEIENQQMGQVKLIKAMPDGGPVSGWVFDIYRKSDNAHMGTFTSSEDGTILSDYLLPGEYLVYEQLDEQSVYWCESENPQAVTIVAGETAEVTFTNRLKPGKISILKVDITGEPLAGAEFLLEWSVDGTNWLPVIHTDSQYVKEGTCTSEGLTDGRLISGEDGIVEFTGLHPERMYRLTETAAPEGFQLLADTAYEGGLPADQDLTVELTVVNVRTFELPETGSKSMVMMPIALALACGMCGVILYFIKRKEQ